MATTSRPWTRGGKTSRNKMRRDDASAKSRIVNETKTKHQSRKDTNNTRRLVEPRRAAPPSRSSSGDKHFLHGDTTPRQRHFTSDQSPSCPSLGAGSGEKRATIDTPLSEHTRSAATVSRRRRRSRRKLGGGRREGAAPMIWQKCSGFISNDSITHLICAV